MLVPIHLAARQLGLTSRTLRHWESAGLIRSSRDRQSGWRVYDPEALQRIRVTALLRQLDIPLREVRVVLDGGCATVAAGVLTARAGRLSREQAVVAVRQALLESCARALAREGEHNQGPDTLVTIERVLAGEVPAAEARQKQWEAIRMSDSTSMSGVLRLITLPTARLAVQNVISSSPEDEALEAVTAWAEAEGLLGGARIYGFNTTAYRPGQEEYGWAASVTIPEQTAMPPHLEERRLPGGVYAILAATNEVYDSWQTMMRLLAEQGEYVEDSSRQCLEEHIRTAEPKGGGNEYYVDLLLPVRKKDPSESTDPSASG